jgi:DNA modification methylase
MLDLINGDCLSFMRNKMEENSVDFTLTDIPYGEVNRRDNGLRKLDKGKADVETFDLGDFVSKFIG